MALPSPLPDDPTKWDGWRRYNSSDPYECLCLSFEARPAAEQIEENSRQILVWWQKKLPLKHQPSNPIAQMLRGGIDSAPRHIAAARAELLDPERRAAIDRELQEQHRVAALVEFQKFLDFALAEKVLTREAEANLFKLARALGLHGADVTESIQRGLVAAGATREADLPPAAPAALPGTPAPGPNGHGPGPANGRRITRLVVGRTPHSNDGEREQFADFHNAVGGRMVFVPTGRFLMGSRTPEAPIDEQPATQVTLRRFYLARYPVTNVQYEQFDPAHRKWRSPGASDDHPVVYVNYFDALKYCAWLSEHDNRRYHLPSEAEWEYAARGTDGRIYPWAPTKKFVLTKFTLTRARGGGDGESAAVANGHGAVAPNLDGGSAELSPVGSHPLGASPFGVEDQLGLVWQWCEDFYGSYKGAERIDPRGPESGTQRAYRGGSWKSRTGLVKTTTRGCNVPTYASNDVGFRVACECAE